MDYAKGNAACYSCASYASGNLHHSSFIAVGFGCEFRNIGNGSTGTAIPARTEPNSAVNGAGSRPAD